MTTRSTVCCPSCGSALTAVYERRVKQAYNHVGQDDGDVIETDWNDLKEIECTRCYNIWYKHSDLMASIENKK